MATWINPKTDWDDEDYYNFGDLNRVENNSGVIAEILAEYAGRPITITTVTNRDMRQIEFFDSLNRIEGNIKYLADNFYAPVGWETPKLNWRSGQVFDYRDAIRLERNLALLYDLLLKTINNLRYCGTFSAGEDGDIY
ncbi:hypothetical protein [Paenibacillus ginsengihumi]|uniref:hypothetical protein n=1 Tax=Paenibacillus ginsengihumi TaxID=431596 RepID=UPI00035F74ED|nr:hypothetical protein [Paenibacillus ginsengihumi]